MTVYQGEKSYPFVLRHELINQIPSLKKKYLKYENYKNETITDIFTAEQLKGAIKVQASQLATCLLVNEGGKMVLRPLPVEAQLAPVYGIEARDFDGDGNGDILLGGNLYETKPQVGRYDASYGLLLTGDGKGEFTAVNPVRSGIVVHGPVRDILTLKTVKGESVLFSRNADSVVTYQINSPR
jgi:hypothetical protein